MPRLEQLRPRQHPEKLIPLCILNALAGDPLPVYGDGMQVRNWIFVEDFCARHRPGAASAARPGEAYNVGGPDELPNIEVVKTILELTGPDESLIEYVTDRPGHDRRYSLASDKVRALGWEPRSRFDEGLAADRRVVPRQRLVVGADPLRRVPRVLRAPVRPRARLMTAPPLETRLDGLVLIEPEVHGDERGFLVETFRDDGWRELGVDVEFVQDNHSRSGRGILRGLHFQTEPGQAKLVRCLAGRIWDVAVDLRRDSPTYRQWEGHELDDEPTASCSSRRASRTASASRASVADVAYKLSSHYDPATEAGIAWDDPDVGVEWPIAEPILSERDRSAPRLAEIADSASLVGRSELSAGKCRVRPIPKIGRLSPMRIRRLPNPPRWPPSASP